jgi:5,10-methylene-tetrahydrofolate dehydrogenase/methenyl tetrahydrofolate cyclohydrolase
LDQRADKLDNDVCQVKVALQETRDLSQSQRKSAELICQAMNKRKLVTKNQIKQITLETVSLKSQVAEWRVGS